MPQVRTREEIKRELERKGQSIAGLARSLGLKPKSVYALLEGVHYGNYGESHRAAVLLGLKEGEVQPERRSA